MRHSRRRGQKIAIVATVLGTALVLVSGYLLLADDSPEPPAGAPIVSITPSQIDIDDIPESFEDLVDPAKGGGSATGSSDPLKNAKGDTSMHSYTFTVRANGAFKYLVRTRDGDGAPKSGNGSVTFTQRIRGPLPAAQLFIQRQPNASAVTCTIAVDGKQVSSATAKKAYQVAACTG